MTKNSISPGAVVTVDFPGATGVKRHPALILSTDLYQRTRPDVIIGLLTSQVAAAVQPTDYILQNWSAAGLRLPTAFRTYLSTMPVGAVSVIGHLSPRDWAEVKRCLTQALAVV
ncbi:MAG: type II toxin-antitoxin system PemK/MazF family toxin [Chloroflexi bacterium]|nr:type II toxin-antitoxin system PemK/MazF family toxin [Chloroflexota bacterium]